MLTVETVSDYLRTRALLADHLDVATTTVEIIDGNADRLVFICTDGAGSSLALRQIRTSERDAAEITRAHVLGLTETSNACPATAPVLYEYDEAQQIVAVEDLTGLTNWRTSLREGHIARGVGAMCGRHIARLSFHTGLYGRSSSELRMNTARAVNPVPCAKTEAAIFVDPYQADDRRLDGLDAELTSMADEPALLSEVARLRVEYVTRAESLVHGDLNPSSLAVELDGDEVSRIKVLDSGTGFYGPAAFDIGTLIGGSLVAFSSALAMGRTDQAEWLRGFPATMWRTFSSEFLGLWSTRSDDGLAEDQGSAWLDRVGADAIGFAACEAIRRVAAVDPILATQPLELQEMAGSAVLSTAQQWLVEEGAQPDDDLLLTLGV